MSYLGHLFYIKYDPNCIFYLINSICKKCYDMCILLPTYKFVFLSFSSGWLYAYTDFYFTHTKTKVIIIFLFSQQLTFLYLKRAKTSKVDKWWSDLFTRDFSIETKTFVEANTMETVWININDISIYTQLKW